MYLRVKNIIFFVIALCSLSLKGAETADSASFVVVIDPGHGGKDSGCVGQITNEKTIVLDVARRLSDLINESYHANIKIRDAQCARNLFSGTIRKSESLEDVLDKICISFNLKIKAEKDSIILY